MISKSKKNSKLFFQFLVMYMIVLLIPVIFSGVTYRKIFDEYMDQIKKTNLAHLIQTREIIDNYTTSIEWKVFHIGENQKLRKLLPLSREEILSANYQVKELIDELASYFIYDEDLTTTCYIHLLKSDIIITPETSFPYSLFNRSSQFSSKDATSRNTWFTALRSTYYRGEFQPAVRIRNEMITHSEEIPFIPYVHSLPILSLSGRPEGVIVFLVSEQKITDLIKRFNIPRGGYASISQGDQIITDFANAAPHRLPLPETEQNEGIIVDTEKGKKRVTLFTFSKKSQWRYTISFPYNYLEGQYTRNLAYWFLFISLLFGGIVALYMAYRNTRPLQKIMNTLGEILTPEKGKGLPRDLQGSVTMLVNRSKILQEELKKQIRFSEKIFFNRLLKGGFRDDEEIRSGLSFAKLTIDEEKFIIIIIAFSPGRGEEALIQEVEMSKVVIKNIIAEVVTGKYYIHEKEDERINLILAYPGLPDKECRQKAEACVNALYNRMSGIDLPCFHIALGGLSGGLMDIHSAYEEAAEALNFAGRGGDKEIIRFNQLGERDYYYPIEVEQNFMNLIKAGDEKQALGILENLYDLNVRQMKLPAHKLELLIMEIHGTFIKLKNHISGQEEIRELRSAPSFEEAFRLIKRLVKKICCQIDEKKKSHNTSLKNRIVSYLDKNYANTELSLYHVASRFGLTEVYLSCFFKEQQGIKFSSYLEKLRIDHSCRLLKETEKTINEIAVLVGYSSDKAFRRAFKRVMNTPPTNYRLGIRLTPGSGDSK